MSAVLHVVPHRDGPWLVRAGQVVLGVPPEIGAGLQPLHGMRLEPGAIRAHLPRDGSQEALVRRLEAGLSSQPGSWRTWLIRRGPVWLRVPLVPARLARAVAGPCRVLTGFRGLGLMGCCGVAGCFAPLVVGGARGGLGGSAAAITMGVALFFLSALWHETGHAAALKRAGYEPGGMGLGLLMILPVLFVDVTPVALLPRRDRLRVNLAGPLFQLSLAGVYQVGAQLLPAPSPVAGGLRIAAASAMLAVTWSLWPFIRSDGYWLICDALNIPGLDQPVPPQAGRSTRRIVAGWRLASMGFFLAMGVVLTHVLDHRLGILPLSRLFGGGQAAVSAWVAVVLAVGLWLGLLGRVLMLARLLHIKRQ